MKERPQENWSPINGNAVDYRLVTPSVAGSVLVHAVLIGLLFLGFDHTPRIAAMPSAINVTMIAAGDLPKAAPAAQTNVALPQPPEDAEPPLVTTEDLAEPEPPPEPEPDNLEPDNPEPVVPEPPPAEPEPAVIPEAPPEKEPVMKKPALTKPEDLPKPIPPESQERVVLKNAPAEEAPPPKKASLPKPKTPPEQPPAKPEPRVIKPDTQAQKTTANRKPDVTPTGDRAESIKEAINKVKARARQNTGTRSDKSAGSMGSGLAANRTGTAAGSGGMTGAISDIYKAQISYQIERNWAFSANLAGGRKDLRTILVITILPTGKIENLWYEQRSGNNFLDQSAYNAVMKSNPLPPLPKGFSEYTIALVFTPAGLN